MSLYPGAPRVVNSRNVLDDTALHNSMAKAMDDAMVDLFKKVKDKDLPADLREDRVLLFAAISRGILQYLSDHQDAMRASVNVTSGGGTFTVTGFNLAVTMGSHTAH